jgi:hypothetical protein
MQLTLEIQNQQEMQLILQYLKSLPGVQVVSGNLSQTMTQTKPVSTGPNKKDFSKYWGCIQHKVPVAEIDKTLYEMRNAHVSMI